MYLLLGISIKLAFLLLVNLAAALIASGIWRLISSPIESLSASARARAIFFLRIGPIAAALFFVAAFVVPAYFLLEPENSGEVVSFKLGLLAGLSSIASILAILRVIKTQRNTRRLERSWRQDAVEISIDGFELPVYRIRHPFPVLALIGIWSPKIFIAEQVLASLTPQELQAALAHERGHLRSHDNLKRAILRICRDLLIVPIGTDLDRAWNENVETAADEFAARSSSKRALDLASALVKLARIARPRLDHAVHAASLLGERDIDVTERVKRLLRIAEKIQVDGPQMPALYVPFWIWPLAFTFVLILNMTDQRLLFATHEAIESFVWIIQ